MKEFSQTFSDRLKELRRGRSKSLFGRFLGITNPSTYHNYENGRVPDSHTVKDIADKCNVSVDWLLGRDAPTVVGAMAPVDQAKLNDVNQEERAKEAARVKQRIGGFIDCMPGCDEAGYSAVKAQIVARVDEYIIWCRAEKEGAKRNKPEGGA